MKLVSVRVCFSVFPLVRSGSSTNIFYFHSQKYENEKLTRIIFTGLFFTFSGTQLFDFLWKFEFWKFNSFQRCWRSEIWDRILGTWRYSRIFLPRCRGWIRGVLIGLRRDYETLSKKLLKVVLFPFEVVQSAVAFQSSLLYVVWRVVSERVQRLISWPPDKQ